LRYYVKKAIPPALFLLVLFPLFARDVEITVNDADLGLPLEGAVIRSWDGKQYTCDRAGKAVVSVPDERQVLIYASYPGYENGRLVISAGVNRYSLGLRLSGIKENKELVIEATKPGSSETKTGRSVGITERDIAQTGQIGLIEDVMTSVKLLPGVGYAGFFNALPSIRGGDPGDMSASLDGYYVVNPYHWGGGFSIFDPRMVQSARLSHGVFSSRYGHTISGLLEIASKDPSPTETEFEFGVNTSAANFNLSLPLQEKGGILFMGRVTFYDPVVALMKGLSHQFESLDPINSVRTAPYIRSTTITGNYRFSNNLELQGTGFWGMDGVGVTYKTGPSLEGNLISTTRMNFDWTNYQGFMTAGLLWNPRNDMLLKFSGGIGYEDAVVDGDIQYDLSNNFSPGFISRYGTVPGLGALTGGFARYSFSPEMYIYESDLMINAQGRIDYDWELGKGFLFAAGMQEMFTRFVSSGDMMMYTDIEIDPAALPSTLPAVLAGIPDLRISTPIKYSPDAENKLFTPSGYTLVEYNTPNNRFGTELGLRVDHYYLTGKGFAVTSKPVLNPRLNVDVNILENKGFLQSLDLSAGTGLFSSMNDMAFFAEEKYKITELKPNRSWTSILGAKTEFGNGLIFNIEVYYKYIFDRMYVPMNPTLDELEIKPKLNGEGRVWGFDLMLQKLQSRYWDGWLSYSFTWAKYRDPDGGDFDVGFTSGANGSGWYYPSFHRFHNLNIVLNFKPAPRFNIYTRFGFASGVPSLRYIGNEPVSYPVYIYDPANPSGGKVIEKYYWKTRYDSNNRTPPSFPLDIKFSIFGRNEKGKAHYELYVAIENVLSLLTTRNNTTFNEYTGKVDEGSSTAAYDMPVPIPSFGFKISY